MTSGSGAAGDISIANPGISFTATSDFAGGTLVYVLEDAFSTSQTQALGTDILTGASDGTLYSYGIGFNLGAVTDLDAFLSLDDVASFSAGDVVTVVPDTLDMNAPDGSLSVFSSGDYEIFLTDSLGSRLSSNGVLSVPEPSSFSLIVLGAVGIVFRRSRQ